MQYLIGFFYFEVCLFWNNCFTRFFAWQFQRIPSQCRSLLSAIILIYSQFPLSSQLFGVDDLLNVPSDCLPRCYSFYYTVISIYHNRFTNLAIFSKNLGRRFFSSQFPLCLCFPLFSLIKWNTNAELLKFFVHWSWFLHFSAKFISVNLCFGLRLSTLFFIWYLLFVKMWKLNILSIWHSFWPLTSEWLKL